MRSRKLWVERGVTAAMVRHARPRQIPARRSKAVDRLPRRLMPTDVEGAELGKELELAVGQVIVDPPGHGLPGRAGREAIRKPGQNDARHRSDAAACVAPVPDVTGVVAFV